MIVKIKKQYVKPWLHDRSGAPMVAQMGEEMVSRYSVSGSLQSFEI
jgi:hypothetical protein